ncbi:hypothetical protein H0H87_002620 [Tephrocybe sp. NHM501043]|nr:hypothetical protein H0H87_002620 [Tephrocybe sp. NHM501043]
MALYCDSRLKEKMGYNIQYGIAELAVISLSYDILKAGGLCDYTIIQEARPGFQRENFPALGLHPQLPTCLPALCN